MSKVCTKHIDLEKGVLIFSFTNGKSVEVNPNDFDESIQTHSMFHGLSQKLGDKFAGAQGDAQVAYEMFMEGLQNLKDGKWIARTVGEGKARVTLLAAALALLSNGSKTEDECAEIVAGLDDDQKKTLNANAKIKAAKDQIKAARSAAKAQEDDTDLSALLQ